MKLKFLNLAFFSRFNKIGLTNFGNNKNVAPFWIQIHFELGLLFLNVVNGFCKDDNHAQHKRKGYAKHGVEVRWHVSRTNPTSSQMHHIDHPWSQSILAPIPMQLQIVTWNLMNIHHDKLQVQQRKVKYMVFANYYMWAVTGDPPPTPHGASGAPLQSRQQEWYNRNHPRYHYRCDSIEPSRCKFLWASILYRTCSSCNIM